MPNMKTPLTPQLKTGKGAVPNTADPSPANTKHTQQASCNMLHKHVHNSGCLDTNHVAQTNKERTD